MEASLRERWITPWALSKSRENRPPGTSQAVTAWARIPLPHPPPPSSLFPHPPSTGDSSKGQKSCTEGPLFLTELKPFMSQKLLEIPAGS